MLSTVLVIVGVLLFLAVILSLSNNLLQIEAQKSGIDIYKEDIGIFPKLSAFGKPKMPSFVNGGSYHAFKKGFDIKLEGEAKADILPMTANTFAVKPRDFRGMAPIPKVEVEVGAEVLAGDVMFYDKNRPEIKYVAPVSGEVLEVRRGAKRAITDIILLADKKMQHRALSAPSLNNVSREDLVAFLMDSGAWPLINKRPFDVVPEGNEVPRDIFISTFDTAPLAPDNAILIEGKQKDFQAGINALVKLTSGKVHLGLNGMSDSWFSTVSNAEKHWFSGKHPAGNVGIHIHHVAPIKLNDSVWTLSVQAVVSIGSLFTKGYLDLSRRVAITGSEFEQTGYVDTFVGANIGDLINSNITEENTRIIDGDVLTGTQKTSEDFLSINADQITIVKEGNYNELFGWLLPISPRPSTSGTFPNFLFPDYKFTVDTNTHGEERAFVTSGDYEQLLPMDIYPQHLMKAVLASDFERMEGLGINELTEEDIALCEFACTSKQPLQKILRQGLEMMREQS